MMPGRQLTKPLQTAATAHLTRVCPSRYSPAWQRSRVYHGGAAERHADMQHLQPSSGTGDGMLSSHMDAIEAVLLAQSTTASNAGHPNLRGGPREWFVRDFLDGHLPSTLEVGQGEIIDHFSQPGGDHDRPRPQVDVVLYRRDMPRIALSQHDRIFLAKGVMATIEVKSELRQHGNGGLDHVCEVTQHHKNLQRELPLNYFVSEWFPKRIVTYLVAFDGPRKMRTVAKWLDSISQSKALSPDEMLDLIVILGKGVLWRIATFPHYPHPKNVSQSTWAFVDQESHNISIFFAHMLGWIASTSPPMTAIEYLRLECSTVEGS